MYINPKAMTSARESEHRTKRALALAETLRRLSITPERARQMQHHQWELAAKATWGPLETYVPSEATQAMVVVLLEEKR